MDSKFRYPIFPIVFAVINNSIFFSVFQHYSIAYFGKVVKNQHQNKPFSISTEFYGKNGVDFVGENYPNSIRTYAVYYGLLYICSNMILYSLFLYRFIAKF